MPLISVTTSTLIMRRMIFVCVCVCALIFVKKFISERYGEDVMGNYKGFVLFLALCVVWPASYYWQKPVSAFFFFVDWVETMVITPETIRNCFDKQGCLIDIPLCNKYAVDWYARIISSWSSSILTCWHHSDYPINWSFHLLRYINNQQYLIHIDSIK